MTAKEYLNKAHSIDLRINSNLEQITALRSLLTKATTTYSDMPPSGSRNIHKMEDIIAKIIDMENEINNDIDHLMDVKATIRLKVSAVEDDECRALLEYRYICFMTWEDIATKMNYTTRYVHTLHQRALSKFETVMNI